MPTHRGRELVKKPTEITVFKDPKDRQVKHHPNTKALTLSIGSGSAKKNF